MRNVSLWIAANVLVKSSQEHPGRGTRLTCVFHVLGHCLLTYLEMQRSAHHPAHPHPHPDHPIDFINLDCHLLGKKCSTGTHIYSSIGLLSSESRVVFNPIDLGLNTIGVNHMISCVQDIFSRLRAVIDLNNLKNV